MRLRITNPTCRPWLQQPLWRDLGHWPLDKMLFKVDGRSGYRQLASGSNSANSIVMGGVTQLCRLHAALFASDSVDVGWRAS